MMDILQTILWSGVPRTLLISLSVLLVLGWLCSRWAKNLPPGPREYPIIGSIPSVVWEFWRGTELLELLSKYAERFGPVYRLKIFNKTLVILNDFSSVRTAFQHPKLNDRPMMLLSEGMQSTGVLSLSGKKWIELRRFCLTVLRGFGVGTTSFEGKIGSEAQELIKEMSNFHEKPFDPKPLLCNGTANIVCSVVLGKRYEYTDQEFKRLLNLVHRSVELLGTGGVVFYFPSLRHLPFFGFKEIMSIFDQFRLFLTRVVDAHYADFDGTEPRDFIDAYIKEIRHGGGNREDGTEEGTRKRGAKHHWESNIIGTVVDMFLAGTETTANTLYWSILYMVVHPDVQQKVQAEIDAVVGRNRYPKMSDTEELNFTQAVIWEIQRLGNIVPVGVMHVAAADAEIGGFLIPKGSYIIANFFSLFQDSSVWSEPEKFKPERFLNDKGAAVKPDELIPFSRGRRSCIGEHLAKMELFIFFTYLMHQFTFKKPEDSPPLCVKGLGGITNTPPNFEICAIERN